MAHIRASSIIRRTSNVGARHRTSANDAPHSTRYAAPGVRTLAPHLHLHPICAPALGRAAPAQLYPNPLSGICAWSAREDGPRPLVRAC